jgi:O-antigen ligase
MTTIIIIYSLLFSVLAVRHINLALLLTIVFLPSYLIRFSVVGIPFTLLEGMLLILFAGFIYQYKFTWLKSFRQHIFFWPIVAILTIASISVFISPNLQSALGIWKAYFIEPVLFYIVFINIIKSKTQLQNIFWALGISATYLSLIGIWQRFSGWNVPDAFLKVSGEVDRIVSVFGYPNALGLFLGPIIILFIGFLFWENKNRLSQIFKISVIALSFIAILLAQSEAAVLSVIAISIFWGLIAKKTRIYFASFIIIGIVAIAITPQINGYLSEKLLLQDYSGFIRRLIWQESTVMLSDNWLFGAGLSGYQVKIAPYHLPTFEIFLYPHNIVLNFWSELGLAGLLAFIWLTILFLWRNTVAYFKNPDNLLSLTLVLVTIQIIIHGLVDVPYFKNDLSILFWMIIGIYMVNQNIKHGGVAELVEGASLEKR